MPGKFEERLPLIRKGLIDEFTPSHQISVILAAACIIDQFGVNPIIVLPKGIIICGWVGYPLVLLVISLTIYTAMLLGRCWVIAEHLDKSMVLKSRYAYSALTEMVWGKTTGRIINFLIDVSVFCSNIPALLIASQNLQFFDATISNYTFNFSYCYWLVILGVALCPLTWLGSPKDTKWISAFSAFSVFTCAFLTWTCMFLDETRPSLQGRLPSPDWQGVSVAFGILTFQFGCHPSILTIQTDMSDKRKLSRSILISFIAIGALTLITASLSGVLYGAETHANLVRGLPVNLFLYFDVILLTLQLFLSTIVGQYTLFQDVEDKFGIPRDLCWQRCLIRSLIVVLVVVFAEILPRFDLVMGIIGGVLTGPITLIFPPLLHLQFRRLLHEEKMRSRNGDKDKTEVQKEEPDLTIRIESQRQMLGNPASPKNPENFTFDLRFVGLPKVNFGLNDEQISLTEFAVSFLVVGIGIIQTAMATYYGATAAVKSTKFLPPCIVSVEGASRITNA
ncbi:hypothetical protein RUM43_010871 [Polyplax serrata]|uniref:Amino acid transporter transmembrane domain-containing protein n=1 Tax=Polyplax serrata TaxID=468196 RepID=A0AAN8NS05_POLSC